MSKAEIRVTAREREARALELRKAGATFAQIGKALGCCESRAWRIVQRALGRVVAEPLEELRQLESLRLDQLLMVMWPKAMAGNGWAVDRCLAIMQRRARLLGLDAPTKHEVLTIDAIDAEIARLEAELRGMEADG
jgi:Homeodomain-like domain